MLNAALSVACGSRDGQTPSKKPNPSALKGANTPKKAPRKPSIKLQAAPILKAADQTNQTSKKTSRQQYIQVPIVSSLEVSLNKVVGPEISPALAQVVKRVLIWWVDIRRDLRRGDSLELIYQTIEGQEPVVNALWFTSEKLKQTRSAVYFKRPNSRFNHWYHQDGREVELRLTHSPVKDYEQITSLLGDGRRHKGVDFKAPVGEPVLAPFDGQITRRNWSTRRNGYCLELKRKDGLRAMFLHLSEIEDYARPGAYIQRGKPIAKVGNTGRSFAPHLHYQLEKGGRVVDPFDVQKTWRARIPEQQVSLVKAELSKYAKMRSNPSE